MPRNHRIPTYRLHRCSGKAVVRVDGRDMYIGVRGNLERLASTTDNTDEGA